MAYTQMYPPPSEELATFVGFVVVFLAVYGLYKILDAALPRRKTKTAYRPISERRRGMKDDQVVVEVIAWSSGNPRSSGNKYSDSDFVSVSISGPWFTQMLLRQAPQRHAEMCRALTDVGLSPRQFFGPPPGSHISGEPFIWAVCRTLESHLRDDGTPRAVFRVTDNDTRLEEIENRIYKGIPV